MIEYSGAELTLIKKLSKKWHDIIVSDQDINPPRLYEILAFDCFCEDRQGPEVEALRRVCVAIQECKIYRMTPEFDNLCKIKTYKSDRK